MNRSIASRIARAAVVIAVLAFVLYPSQNLNPTVQAQTACTLPPPNMVGWWPGDGNGNDIQAGNNGTLLPGVAFGSGNVGLAFSFGNTHRGVNMGVVPALVMTNTMSVDAWIYPTGPGTGPGGSGGIIVNKEGEYEVARWPDGTIRWAFRNTNPGWHFHNTKNVAPLNQWTHIVVTYNAGVVKTYLNGALKETFNGSGNIGDQHPAQNEFRIGNRQRQEQGFNGLIDEVELFNRALSIPEILAIYLADSAGKCKRCATPPANMVGWWPADGNTTDITPSPDNGTLNGGAMFASGEVANAFSLNGTTAFVSAPDPHNKLNFGMGDLSIDAWIKTSNANGIQVIVDKRVGDNATTFTGYVLFTFNGNLGVQLADGTFKNFFSVTNVADGAFHHVAVTVVRTSATGGNLYVDGVSVLTFDPTGRPFSLTNSAELRIGRHSPNTILDTFFNGLIDEVELFDRALGAEEVQAIFEAGGLGKCKCTITCPANITKSNDPNQCGAIVTYPAPNASAGCGTVTCSPASDSFFPIGATIVNCSTTAGPSCSFMVTVGTQLNALSPAKVWIGLKNNDDVGTNFDVHAEVLKNGTTVGAGQINNVPGGGSGFNNAVLRSINLALSSPVIFGPGDTLSFRLSVRVTAVGGHAGGTARLWYDGKAIDTSATRDAGSRFGTTIPCSTTYFLRGGFLLNTTAGSSKQFIDVPVTRTGGNPFMPFGTWSTTF